MPDRNLSDSELSSAADMPVVKAQKDAPSTDCIREIQLAEQSLTRLKRSISHQSRQSDFELFQLQRELKDALALTNTLREQLEQQQHTGLELERRLSQERTANLRLSREHDQTMEKLGKELHAAKLLLGDALGGATTPARSVVARQQGRRGTPERSRADTVRPKASGKD